MKDLMAALGSQLECAVDAEDNIIDFFDQEGDSKIVLMTEDHREFWLTVEEVR